MTAPNPPKYNKWEKYEKDQDEVLIEASKKYEERLRQKESRSNKIENNRKIINQLDPKFMENCFKSFVLTSFAYNLSLIILNYGYLTRKITKGYKRVLLISPMFIVGNLYSLAYWMYSFPIDQYNKGLVKIMIEQPKEDTKLV